MKRFLFIITVIATIAFIGCSKDKDEPSLVGTAWEQVEDGVSVKLTFQSTVDCQIVISSSDSPEGYINTLTYEYDHPNVRMYPRMSGYAELKGIIDGNTMNVINTSTGKTIDILTKK